MNNAPVANLSDCSQFRQTLLAKPPAIVHGTAILLVILVVVAVAWASITQANLVIQAPGRVRPENRTFQVFIPESPPRFGYSAGGEVQEVLYREGDTVSEGQVLIRLNTDLLDEEHAKLDLTLETCQAELDRLEERKDLLSQRFEVAIAKAEVELLQAEEETQRATRSRESEVRRAEAELHQVMSQHQRLEKLRAANATSDVEVEEMQLKVIMARTALELAQQPIDERKKETRLRELELVKRDYALQCKELEVAQTKKRAEYEQAKKDQITLARERRRAVLSSPIDGIVTTEEVKVGDVLKRGAPVVEIVEQGALHFEAIVSSKEASHLRQGMPVRIKLDAYDHHWYGILPAKVAFISPDSRVKSDGNASHVGYEVRIRLEQQELRRGDRRGEVSLGLTGTAEIITDRKSVLSILRRNIQHSISLGG